MVRVKTISGISVMARVTVMPRPGLALALLLVSSFRVSVGLKG